jgi:hypothetical protein
MRQNVLAADLGAVAGRDLHPLEKRRLVTAHVKTDRQQFLL